jgi:hypothetical protein
MHLCLLVHFESTSKQASRSTIRRMLSPHSFDVLLYGMITMKNALEILTHIRQASSALCVSLRVYRDLFSDVACSVVSFEKYNTNSPFFLNMINWI